MDLERENTNLKRLLADAEWRRTRFARLPRPATPPAASTAGRCVSLPRRQ